MAKKTDDRDEFTTRTLMALVTAMADKRRALMKDWANFIMPPGSKVVSIPGTGL